MAHGRSCCADSACCVLRAECCMLSTAGCERQWYCLDCSEVLGKDRDTDNSVCGWRRDKCRVFSRRKMAVLQGACGPAIQPRRCSEHRGFGGRGSYAPLKRGRGAFWRHGAVVGRRWATEQARQGCGSHSGFQATRRRRRGRRSLGALVLGPLAPFELLHHCGSCPRASCCIHKLSAPARLHPPAEPSPLCCSHASALVSTLLISQT